MGIGIPALYVLLGGIVGVRCYYGVLSSAHSSLCHKDKEWYGKIDECDCFMRQDLAITAGVFWPIGLLILLGWYIAKPRAQIRRAQRKLKALEADIAEREKELGIGRIA